MKYAISFHGIDVEILMSEAPEKMLNHFKDSDLDVGGYMCGESEEVSDDITGGACADNKNECDGLYHNRGSLLDDSVTMLVNKVHPDGEFGPSSPQSGEEIYSCSLDNPDNLETENQVNAHLLGFDAKCVLVGEIYSKGFSSEYTLELNDDEAFDPEKLTLMCDDIDEMYQIVVGVRYNGIDIERTGEMSTEGVNERWYITNAETGETTLED
jgi:hypothetical protein